MSSIPHPSPSRKPRANRSYAATSIATPHQIPPPTPSDKSNKANTTAGVKSYEVSLENQTASVVAEPSLEYATVLRTIAKTGKKVNKGVADGVEQSVEVPAA